MALVLPSTYTVGTATVDADGVNVTGQNTFWGNGQGGGTGNPVLPGDFFGTHVGFAVRILEVVDDTHLILANPWVGESQAAAPYEIMLTSDMARVQESTRRLLQQLQNGNIEAFTGLEGAADRIPMFTGPGAMTTIDRNDLVNGVNFDANVPTLADRAEYDGEATGFSVFVGDIGDGRAAVYFKRTATSGDWSDPAFITGERGLPGLIWRSDWNSSTAYAVGDVVFYDNASWVALAASTNVTPVEGANWDLLAARGAPGRSYTSRGTYNAATAYAIDDTVLYQGSTYIAIATTTGNAPPNLPATSNAWWQLQAQKGTDGTGVGDVVGTTTATDGALVGYSGTTGKAIKALTTAQAKAWLATTALDVSFDNSVALLDGNPATTQAAINALAARSTGGKNDAIFALELADLKGQRQGFVGGVADAFEDTTGVVTAGIGGIDGYTVALLHADGANGSTTFTDSSFIGSTWSIASGSPTISTAQSKFGGASILIPSGGAISAPWPSSVSIGTGDFTVDAQIRMSSYPGAATVFEMRSAAGSVGHILFVNGTGKLAIFAAGADRVASVNSVPLNEFVHVAMSRVSGTTRIFINGNLEGSYADTINVSASTAMRIGSDYTGGSPFVGNIDEIRFSRVGRYSAAFTPPTMAYNVVGGVDANTRSLLHFDGPNGSTIITDSGAGAYAWAASSAAAISTAQSKFGGSSLLINGSLNNFLISSGAGAAIAFGTGDYTIECWVRPAAIASLIIIEARSSGNLNSPVMYTNASGKLVYNVGGAQILTGGAATLAVGNWYHVAVCRSSGVTRSFVNGILDSSASDASNVVASPQVYIGSDYTGNSNWNGNIDEVRISNVARYTSNFTPWNVAFFVETAGSSNFVYDATNDWFSPVQNNIVSGSPSTTTDYSAGTFADISTVLPSGESISAIGVNLANAKATSVKILRRNSAGNYDVVLSQDYAHPGGGYSDCVLSSPYVVPATGTYIVGVYLSAGINTNRTPGTFRAYNSANATGSSLTFLEATANVDIPPFRIVRTTPALNMTLVSVNYQGDPSLTKARVALQLADTLTLVPGTDFAVDVSRDGGNTWTAATMTRDAMLYSQTKIYEGSVDLASQPAGSLMAWRFRTLTGKNIIASGMVLQQG